MKKLAMIIDPGLCIDCKACLIACRTEHNVPFGQHRNWVRQSDADGFLPLPPGISFQPGACMHCENAPCVNTCPTGASFKDISTGEVKVDKGLCIGCGHCIDTCPYEARYLNSETKRVDKCDYCAARRSLGLEPACVNTCPTGVRTFGDIADSSSIAYARLKDKSVLKVESSTLSTEPNMYYISATHPVNWPIEKAESFTIPLLRFASSAFGWLASLLGLALIATGFREYLLPDKKESLQKSEKEPNND